MIGYVGTSGRSTGPHLHFEILVDGRQVDPFEVTPSFVQRIKGGAIGAFENARAKVGELGSTIGATASSVLGNMGLRAAP